jgi:hypothetical protein
MNNIVKQTSSSSETTNLKYFSRLSQDWELFFMKENEFAVTT